MYNYRLPLKPTSSQPSLSFTPCVPLLLYSFAFKLGPEGQGYYSDRPPKALSKAQLQQLTQRTTKGPIVPIGPQGSTKR